MTDALSMIMHGNARFGCCVGFRYLVSATLGLYGKFTLIVHAVWDCILRNCSTVVRTITLLTLTYGAWSVYTVMAPFGLGFEEEIDRAPISYGQTVPLRKPLRTRSGATSNAPPPTRFAVLAMVWYSSSPTLSSQKMRISWEML